MGQGENLRPLCTQDKDGDSGYCIATGWKPRHPDMEGDKIWSFLGEIYLQASYKDEGHFSGLALSSQKRRISLEEVVAVERATEGPYVPLEGMLKYIVNQDRKSVV